MADAHEVTRDTSSKRRKVNPSSSTSPKFTVFISHAGEDKSTMAIPLRKKLVAHGITAFVDEPDMPAGTDAPAAMIAAMETATVAVIILSPEFVARKWPIKELMCFLRRRDERAAGDPDVPVLIPFFYRLSISELYAEPLLDRVDKDGKSLYLKSRFLERMNAGEPEAQTKNIKASLKKLSAYMGVRNHVQATNDTAYDMCRNREILLQELCDKIRQCVPAESMTTIAKASDGIGQSQQLVDGFRTYFPPSSYGVQAVLDFDSEGEHGNHMTDEGLVKTHLLKQTNGSRNVTSICGIGGVGKSTILKALSVDNDIRVRFPDGVHSITLGQDASIATLFQRICQVLKDSGAEKTVQSLNTQNDIDEALRFFQTWFDGKQSLFLIDDAWVHGIGIGFFTRLCNIASGTSRNGVLITTRQAEIASLAPTEKVVPLKPRVASGPSARDILFFHADRQESDQSSTSVNGSISRILDICAGLPVSLAAAGKSVKEMRIGMLKDADRVWKVYRDQLVRHQDSLLQKDVETYGNLFATFAVSIAIMEAKARAEPRGSAPMLSFRDMHRRLCVLQKQDAAPSIMLRYLWATENDADAVDIGIKFVNMGLASSEIVRVESADIWHLRLHDSLHDFAIARALDDAKNAHELLLKAYRSSDPGICSELDEQTRWWSTSLKADGYIHRNLCRHLLAAGRRSELVQLLMSPQWIERQLQINGILSLEADFSLGIKALHLNTEDEIDDDRAELEEALQLISEAATLGWRFVTRNFKELWFQLQGRLVEHATSNKSIGDFLDRIEEEEKALHVRCLNGFLVQAGGALMKVITVGAPLICLALFADGDHVACGSDDGKIFVVDLVQRAVKEEWQAHDKTVRAITILEEGTRRRILSASSDSTVKVWLVESCSCVATFTGHTDAVNAVDVMQDGRRVVSVSDDGTAQVWQMDTAQVVTPPFTNHKEAVRCVAVMGDGEHVVTGGDDKKLRLWKATTGEQVGDTFDGHEDSVTCVVASPSGRRIVSGSWDDTIRCWSVDSHQQLGEPFRGHTDDVECVAVRGTSRRTNQKAHGVLRLPHTQGTVRIPCMHREHDDGHQIVSGSDDNTIRVWDSASGTEICAPLEGHTNYVYGVSFLGDSNSIVSCSLDGTVRVWNLGRQKKKKIASRHGQSVLSVKFSPNGKFVVSGSWDKTIRIWNTTSGDQVGHPLLGHTDDFNDVAITSDGRRLLSVSDDDTLRVWDLESRQLLQTFTGHTSLIWCVAVIPHSDRAVTGSGDQTLRIWDLAAMDGSPVVFDEHSAAVRRVFTSDDGLRIISVDYDDNAFVWELETRNVIKRVTHEDAWKLSRRQVLHLVGETTIRDTTTLSIPVHGREIIDGEGADARVLATLESDVESWALSPDQRTICIGLRDGQVAFMKLKT